MPRDIPVGNGSLLVTFDEQYRIRDLYFPFVGKENHTEGHPFRFGVWADGAFSWVGDGWRRELRYLEETLVTDVRLVHEGLALEITSNDAVDFQENVFLRRVSVRDLRGAGAREVRLFFHQDFYISESEVGDTAFFDPDNRALIHYKGRRYFLISTDAPEGVETFATGRKAFGHDGTWRDAEDGRLSDHAIFEGSVDSTVGRTLRLPPGGAAETFYRIAVGQSREEVAALNSYVRERTPGRFIRTLYRPLVTRAADFIARFRDERTALPLPSWNLWEDRFGVHTFACATVVGALAAAARFASLFGEREEAGRYERAADEVKSAMRAHLYREDLGRFARALVPSADGAYEVDATADASLFGLFYFGAFDPRDEQVRATMRAVEERLWTKTGVGGVARFEGDGYMRAAHDDPRVAGNPWFICTLWLADYRVAAARSAEELRGAAELLSWVAARSLPSGVLPEQVDPLTGAALSVSPLTWSHSTFIATVMTYLEKLSALRPAGG